MAEKGYVDEIFASVQGEGVYVGERQVFVRMSGCSAACSWCDTPHARERQAVCVIRGPREKKLDNPLSVENAASEVLALIGEAGPIRTVSLTGGEPLEQAPFVGALAARLKDEGLRVYLETNGLESEGLDGVAACVDVIALDIKLPSALGTPRWEEHRAFLHATEGVERFVKIVVDGSSSMDELKTALEIVAAHDPGIPVVIQPEGAALSGAAGPVSRSRVLTLVEDAQRYALAVLRDVRVIPQCHKILKVR